MPLREGESLFGAPGKVARLIRRLKKLAEREGGARMREGGDEDEGFYNATRPRLD